MKHRRGIDLIPSDHLPSPIGDATELDWMTFEKLSEWYVLGARCGECRRTNWLDRWALSSKYGKHKYLKDLRPKLRCIHCKTRGHSTFVIGKMPRNA